MTTIEETLYSKISGEAAVAALIDTRLYPLQLPQDPVYPALTYQRIATERPYAHDGAGDFASARFQFNCFAASYWEMRQLANTLRQAIDCFSGEVNGMTIWAILFIDEFDIYQDTAEAYMLPLDFRVIYKEISL